MTTRPRQKHACSRSPTASWPSSSSPRSTPTAVYAPSTACARSRRPAGRPLPMSESAFNPTPEQLEAITHPLTPVFLVAGAGAGKTSVMAERILWLVEEGHARPDEVLALTFTNKAAFNLKEKVRQRLGADADVIVATYHAFGSMLIADHALELDLDPSTKLLNRAQAWQLLYSVFDELRFDRRRTLSPQVLLDDALALASRCADHLL